VTSTDRGGGREGKSRRKRMNVKREGEALVGCPGDGVERVRRKLSGV
jgi:hypothetical protein